MRFCAVVFIMEQMRHSVTPAKKHRILLQRIFAALLPAMLCLQAAVAADYTWAGGGDGTSWSDSANWTPPGVPESADTATINTASAAVNITLDGDITVVTLTVIGANTASIDLGGNELSVTTLNLGTGDTYSTIGHLSLSNGSVTAGTLDPANKTANTLYLDNTDFVVTELIYTNGTVTTTVSSSGDSSFTLPNGYEKNGKIDFDADLTVIASDTEWTGNVDDDWDNPDNWKSGVVPTEETDVTIPATVASGNFPAIKSGTDAKANSVTNEGTLTFAGGTLSVVESITNGTDSVIIYTAGTDLHWGYDYEHLAFLDNADSTGLNGTIEDDLTVSGTMYLGNNVSLTVKSEITADSYEDDSAAELILDSGTLSVASTVTTAGTITVNDGTIEAEGTIAKLTLAGSATLKGGAGLEITSAEYNGNDVAAIGKVTLAEGTIGTLTAGDGTTASKVAGAHKLGMLIAEGNATFTANADITIGSVEIRSGGTFAAGAGGSSHRITLSGDWENSGTFICENSTVEFTAGAAISGDTTFYDFTCTGITLTFEAGSTQTIENKLNVSGAELTGSGEWFINVSPANVNVTGTKITNSNANREGTWAKESLVDIIDSSCENGGGTTRWFEAVYYWLGTADTDWDNAANWVDATGNAMFTAPEYENETIYVGYDDGTTRTPAYNPLLAPADLELKKVIVTKDSTLDLQDHNLETKDAADGLTLKEGATLRLHGTQTISGKVNGVTATDCTVVYYGECSALPLGDSYENLAFEDGAEGTITSALSVNGTTTIANGTGNALELSGTNSFKEPVTIGDGTTPGGAITINSDGNLVIAKDAECDSLIVQSAVTLSGDVTTSGDAGGYGQTYNGAVAVTGDATLSLAAGSRLLFEKNVTAEKSLTVDGHMDISGTEITAKETLTLRGDIVAEGASLNMSADYILADGNAAREWKGSITFASDTYININAGTALSIENDMKFSGSLYFYSGSLRCDGVTLDIGKDFAAFGTNYDAEDKDWHVSGNTRYAYYGKENLKIEPIANHAAEFADLAGCTLTVGENFYVNGADMSSGAFNLSNKARTAPPIMNENNFATQDMWGTPYSVAFNMTAADCTAANWVTAATPCTETVSENSVQKTYTFTHQNVTDGGNNDKWQFEAPRIESAYTVYDDVVFVEFNMPLANGSGQVKSAISSIKYDDNTIAFEGAYNDKDYAGEIPDGDIKEMYLKASGTWNTDATGKSKGDADDYSTDRNGVHQETKPNITLPEGAFYAAEGYTLCAHYHPGKNLFESVEDHTPPVLVGVLYGQETHDTASQKPYDAHNFIELRYSEPVDIEGIDISDGAENVQSTEKFGAITNNNPGFTIAGLVTIPEGTVVTGIAGAEDCINAHALYRSFEGGKCGVRLSIAGYKDGNKWEYYIESDKCELPGGSAQIAENVSVKDKADEPNLLDDSYYTGNHALDYEDLLTVKPHGDLGGWDISPPVFAPIFQVGSGSGKWQSWAPPTKESHYEAIGTTSSSSAMYLEQLEFHLFDNTPDYSKDEHRWYFRRGWLTGTWASNTEAATEIPPYDTTGGARGFDSKNKTSGGIRACTLEGASSAFSYISSMDSSIKECPAGDVAQVVTSIIFTHISTGSASTAYKYECPDGLYFSVALNGSDTTLPIMTTFEITYDDKKAFITDLAGNRLKGYTIRSMDRTPPNFSLLVAPIESPSYKNANKIMVVFSKKLSSSIEKEDFIDSFEIKSRDGTDGPKIENAYVKANTQESTTIVLELEDYSIKFSDLTNLMLCMKKPEELEEDPITGIKAYVTKIKDDEGNYMVHTARHAISDFAVNAVDVLYAWADVTDEAGEYLESGLYGEGSYAVRDFSGIAENYNTVLANKDIIFSVRVNADSDTDISSVVPKMYFDVAANVPAAAASDKYNRHTGSSWRVWLPTELDTLASAANVPLVADGIMPDSSDTKDPSMHKFFVPAQEQFVNGAQMQFLFELQEGGSPILFDHDCDGATENVNGETADIPLYALAIRNISDLNSIDLWSLKIKSQTLQRGGATILNNVINVNVREQAVLRVDMPSAGNLNVFVMTLDGNIVRRLAHGRVTEGTHYYRWDGTNNSGNAVARGLYFVRVTGPGIDETRKVMCVKE